MFSVAGIPQSLVHGIASIEDLTRCRHCGFMEADVRVGSCGCALHARCIPLSSNERLAACPHCKRPCTSLILLPMTFREIDAARKTAAALANRNKRNRKRKNSDEGEESKIAIDREKSEVSDRRTGRWTMEEMNYVDQLIAKFEAGHLPILDGIKLNDFLASMLKSKQSRLTKKMKNAKLSAKSFKRTTGYIPNQKDAKDFSELEDCFFHSIQCQLERAEIKFHLQKEWREMFSNYCVTIGQPLEADSWLSSVEEMDRRASKLKDAARMARRKLMMCHALRQDSSTATEGVIITGEETLEVAPVAVTQVSASAAASETEEFLSFLNDRSIFNDSSFERNKTSSSSHATFLSKVMAHLQSTNVPFELVDAWVPSFVSNNEPSSGQTQCRLCFAGHAIADFHVGLGSTAQAINSDEHSRLASFADYSQNFSFDVGRGIPGRVYENGIPSWEQSVENAPADHFERCGGAKQFGIKTVVGIPVVSPNVGRIIIALYSCHDREKDQNLVSRLCEEFNRLLPCPKWKLVVDIGQSSTADSRVVSHIGNSPALLDNSPVASSKTPSPRPSSQDNNNRDSRVDELISLLGQQMPSDPQSPLATYVPTFMTIRLMMLKSNLSDQERGLVSTLLDSYSSYSAAGRSKSDIAILIARDCMFLSQQQQQQQQTQRHATFRTNQAPNIYQQPSIMDASKMPAINNMNAHSSSMVANPPTDCFGVVNYSSNAQPQHPNPNQHQYWPSS